jgi:hypothetical protein
MTGFSILSDSTMSGYTIGGSFYPGKPVDLLFYPATNVLDSYVPPWTGSFLAVLGTDAVFQTAEVRSNGFTDIFDLRSSFIYSLNAQLRSSATLRRDERTGKYYFQWTVDPTDFSVSWDAEAGYYLGTFGIQAVTAGVPEPSSWALLALGFAGLGVAGARRGRYAH